MPDNILVIAAHPDDEILGCGASMAKHIDRGDNVNVLIMAEGYTSRQHQRNKHKADVELSNLKTACLQACKILGVNNVDFAGFPDNRMDSVDLLDVIKVVETYIDQIKPSTVYTHFCNDLNIDHRIVFESVQTACRPTQNNSVISLLSFEIQSSTEWQSNIFGQFFAPNFYINIEKYLELKLKALKIYKSEMRSWPHPRSIPSVELLAKLRGSQVGLNAAEAFVINRAIDKSE